MPGTDIIERDAARCADSTAIQPSAQPLTLLDELLPPNDPRFRRGVAIGAIVMALISFFVVAPILGSPETYAATIASLDSKRETVTSLIGGATGTSAAITLLPGDVGTPIAEKLLDLSGHFAIVIGAIYLEKYLLTTLGLAAFRILVPLGCALLAAGVLLRDPARLRAQLQVLGTRLAVFGIAIALVVPASVFVSDQIEATYQASIDMSLAAAEQAQADAAAAAAAEEEGEEGAGGVLGIIQSIPEAISDTASGVSQEAQDTLNRFIETFAVMIVTSCIIPILVLVFFLWLAKTILGVRVEVSMQTQARVAGMLAGRRR